MSNARKLGDKAQHSSIIQIATTTLDGVVTSSTGGVPSTITNGVQIFSLSFTPKSADSTILVQTSSIVVAEESNGGDIAWLALWNGSTFVCANSGNALYSHFAGTLNMAHLSLNNSFAAGSTATRTIQVRAGMNNGTVWANGNSNLSSYNFSGSSARVQMTVWELAP